MHAARLAATREDEAEKEALRVERAKLRGQLRQQTLDMQEIQGMMQGSQGSGHHRYGHLAVLRDDAAAADVCGAEERVGRMACEADLLLGMAGVSRAQVAQVAAMQTEMDGQI